MSSIKNTGTLFLILFFASLCNEAYAKKKVCIIGAGRAGLAATKIVADQLDQFEPIAFERNSDIGGVWIYRDDPELDENGMRAHSGIYKSLKTITTKRFMMYPDYQPSGRDHGYVSHEIFLKYMRNYAKHFGLREYIQFNTLVTTVRPLNDNCTHGKTRWILDNRNLKTHENDAIICDAVIVCNGRYSKPNIPNIPGMKTFQGEKLHSRSYRIPQDFSGKTVIILGAQASGSGIARDLSPHAKMIYLSHRQTFRLGLKKFPKNVIEANAVVKIEGNQFILDDGNKITADVLIFCTGYVYNFPFLSESSGITFDEHHLFNLHQTFINKKYPSMALIGLGDDDGFTSIYYSEKGLSYPLKLVANQEGKFEPLDFEQNSDIGGLWIYTDEGGLDKFNSSVHSSIYKNLRTITPNEFMIYPDYPKINSTYR